MIAKSGIDLPGHLRLNIPGDLLLESPNTVAVRINSANHDIDSHKTFYAGRLFNFEIEDDLFLEPDIMELLKGSKIKMEPSAQIFAIGKNLRLYKNVLPVFAVRADSDLLKTINYLTAFGFQVHIDTEVAPDNDAILEKALQFYLHNPLLKTPIEPFHSLLKTLGARAHLTLWDTEYEKLNSNAYISASGDMSLSRRWLANGHIYGNIDDSWDKLTASPLYSRLIHYREELFRQKAPCIFCSHLDICGGFLKAVDSAWPCQPWIKAFDMLKNEAARAKMLLRDMEKGAK